MLHTVALFVERKTTIPCQPHSTLHTREGPFRTTIRRHPWGGGPFVPPFIVIHSLEPHTCVKVTKHERRNIPLMERLREHPGEGQRTCPFPLYWQQKLVHSRSSRGEGCSASAGEQSWHDPSGTIRSAPVLDVMSIQQLLSHI